ncbi:UNVERIFIED_ORG: hypothetical protein FHR35_000963 [Microbispora rosea subsp. rosea]
MKALWPERGRAREAAPRPHAWTAGGRGPGYGGDVELLPELKARASCGAAPAG